MSRGRPRRGVRWLLALPLVLLLASPTAPAQDELLPSVKAAFVFNFIKLVSWPAPRFAGEESPVRVCVQKGDAMQAALQQSLEGRTVGPRAIRVTAVEGSADLDGCHVLYLGAQFEPRYEPLMAAVAGKGVLLVDEGRRFTWPDGMIRLFVDGQRVRFELNLQSVERAGLKIDPILIRLAQIAAR